MSVTHIDHLPLKSAVECEDEHFSTIKHRVSILTGLSADVLDHDPDSGVSWEDSIVAKLMSDALLSASFDFNLRQRSIFSASFLDLMKVDDFDHVTLKEAYHILISYAINSTSNSLPGRDTRGFPSDFSALPAQRWTAHSSLPREIVLYLHYDASSGPSMPGAISARWGDSLCFHGTSWEYALSIIHEGVSLSCGQARTDFGPQCFYLYDKFKLASRIATQKHRGQPAVLVFTRRWRDEVPAERALCYEPSDAFEWKQAVFALRSCNREHIRAMESYDVIEGPLMRKVTAVRCVDDVEAIEWTTGSQGGERTTCRPSQIAVRNKSLESKIDECLVGIVFLSA